MPGAALLGSVTTAAAASSAQTDPAVPAETAWKLICPEATADAPAQPCSLIQNLVAGEQKQRLLTVIMQKQPAAPASYGLTIALPHGVLFPPGISVQIDDAAATKLAVQTSDQNGAYTGTPVDAAMLTAMKGGKTLKIGFSTNGGQNIIVPVTLKDFGPGLKQLDAAPAPAAPAAKTSAATPKSSAKRTARAGKTKKVQAKAEHVSVATTDGRIARR